MADRPERRIGVDTNVLIGPEQKELGDLMQVAEEIVVAISDKGAILPTQALSEFFNGTTKGTDSMLGRDVARGRILDLMKSFEIVQVTKADVDNATQLACRHESLTIYDSQLLVVFSRVGCRYFLTRDKDIIRLGSYKGMEIVNPFEEGFDLDALLDSCREDAPDASPAGDPVPPAPAGPGSVAVPEGPGVAEDPGDGGAPEVEDVPRNWMIGQDMPEGYWMLEALVALAGIGITFKSVEVTINTGHSERQAPDDA